MSITGERDGRPLKVGVALGDVVTGLYATIGIVAALYSRNEDGRGQRIETNLLSSLLAAMVNQTSAVVSGGVIPHRMGNAHPSIAPYETLRTADDEEIVVAVGNDRQFSMLCKALGAEQLTGDPRFRHNEDRVRMRRILISELERHLAHRSAGEWMERLRRAGVPCGRVNDIEAALRLAEELEFGPVRQIRRPNEEPVSQIANPLDLSGTPVAYAAPPPFLGEHDQEIRHWLAEAIEDADAPLAGTNDAFG